MLRSAFADKDWAVRVRAARAAEAARSRRAANAAAQIRPAPTTLSRRTCMRRRAWSNPPVSTQVYIETDRGTIQIELAVLDAPLTVENFVALARKGFFDGLSVHRVVPDFVVQDGDPRGDGEGGPGLLDSRRTEPAAVPARHRRHGARPWPDTGGSQFFITHSPQPHLDAQIHGLRPRHRGHGRRRSDSAVGCDSARADLGWHSPTATGARD